MELNKLALFIGTWKTSGIIEKSPLGPAGKLTATDRYEWSFKKDFILHKASGKMSRKKFANSEVISFDPSKQSFALYSFEKGTSTGIMFGKLTGKKWSVNGKTMRFRGVFNTEKNQLTGEWQFKNSKAKWALWMTVELNKI